MKLMFVEVRSKTKLFESLAHELSDLKPELVLSWLIMNPFYRPKRGALYELGFPKIETIENLKFDRLDEKVISSDRFSIHFNREPWYYPYYRKMIEQAIAQEKPDFIIGELGTFYAHYACLIAKQLSIPFYDIESARFPNGCISIFEYDRWNPVKLQDVSDSQVWDYLKYYETNRPVPDYMGKNTKKISRLKKALLKKLDTLKVLLGYLSGESFNTQNPLENFVEKKKVISQLRLWDKCRVDLDGLRKINKKVLLYPLQMQPEFNLEVWGAPNNKQLAIIEKLARALPSDWVLLLKANPKPYFEMNRLEISNLYSRGNVYFLDRAVPMADISEMCDLVATVTGTIQIERLLAGKSVYIIGDTPFRDFSVIKSNIDSLSETDISGVSEYQSDNNVSFKVAKYLLEHAMPGEVSEPVSDPKCLRAANVSRLAHALLRVLGDKGSNDTI
ncbi:hypothetical protein FMN52_16000 [Marinobacter sp. BW6]|uniref:hypothetical protein n=1 Tax=Marinobacter sp. BW6 TaxID=2592624 RepID=UPI0011DE68DE|nr:hypothetical protein [Marinobacter sp. BW6]TYC58040.1 hypothetical protein FMN52_16000 [Marinobacter sp. BW6]